MSCSCSDATCGACVAEQLAEAQRRIVQLTPCGPLTAEHIAMLQDWCDKKHDGNREPTFGIEWCRKLLAALGEAQAEVRELRK